MTQPNHGTAAHAAELTRGRHPGVQTAMAWLAFSHLPEALRDASRPFYQTGIELLFAVQTDSAELTTALNKLVEAKDWAVRALIRHQQGVPGPVPRPAAVVDAPVSGSITVPDDTSDGHHTFGELYDHRRALTAALCFVLPHLAWRSKAHHPDDDPMFDGGYFIVGIDLPTGTITYHYKLTHWDDFAHVAELEHGRKWDGAPPSATIERLLALGSWAND